MLGTASVVRVVRVGPIVWGSGQDQESGERPVGPRAHAPSHESGVTWSQSTHTSTVRTQLLTSLLSVERRVPMRHGSAMAFGCRFWFCKICTKVVQLLAYSYYVLYYCTQ